MTQRIKLGKLHLTGATFGKLTNKRESKTTSEGALGSTDRTKVLQLVDWRSAEMSKAHRWIVGKTTEL